MNRRTYRSVSLLVALLVVLSARASLAGSYEAALARGLAARERAFDTGSERDWREAFEQFAAAMALAPSKEAGFELAEAAARLQLLDEACVAYREALELGLTGNAELRARQFLDEHTTGMGQLRIEGPAGARVYVNQRWRAVLPLAQPLWVSAGKLVLQVEAPSFRAWESELELQPGETTLITPELQPERQALLEPRLAPGADRAPEPSRAAAEAPPTARGWAMPTAFAGGGLLIVGAAGVVTTTVLLAQQRRALADNCVELRGNECSSTTATEKGAAQAAANQVVTLEALRWAAAGAGAAGAAAALVGAWQLSREKAKSHGRLPALRVSTQEVSVEWQAAF